MIKDVPYFPFYAANIMSSRAFKLMSLGERGLYITIMMECWVNGGVPSNLAQMAKILGLSLDEVKAAYTNLHSTFFQEVDGQIISLELEAYRKGFLEKREKQKLGGMKGAENKKKKNSQLPKGQPRGSLSYISSNSINSNQLLSEQSMSEENKSWLKEFDMTPDLASEYQKAKGGW